MKMEDNISQLIYTYAYKGIGGVAETTELFMMSGASGDELLCLIIRTYAEKS